MDRQDIKRELLEYLLAQRELLVRSKEQAKAARDSAPSAMESHSDTTRSEKEKLVAALERDIAAMDGHIKTAAKMDVVYMELTDGNLVLRVLLVPDGIGGKKIDDMTLVSVGSPLGLALVGKQFGDEIEFNGKKWQISSPKALAI